MEMPIHRAARRVVAAACPLLWMTAASAQIPVPGITPGSFSVSANGAATYTIPIQVPPGRGGMAPQVALSYSSQSGSGLLGVGWSLTAASSITRCPRTPAQDGVRRPVRFDTEDRFCLDGQRLIRSSGTHGAEGTTYRTEMENFTLVTSHQPIGYGPTWFEARTKSGEILEFGRTEDSRLIANGSSAFVSWSLSRIADRRGNYMTFRYSNDYANGQLYLTRIDYTGNASLDVPAFSSVRFDYEPRADAVSTWNWYNHFRTASRLRSISTWVGETPVKDYRVSYIQTGAANRSLLATVRECDGPQGDARCLQLTWFGYQTGDDSRPKWPVVTPGFGTGGSPADRWFELADVDGDGIPDAVRYEPASGNVIVSRSLGNGEFGPPRAMPWHGGGSPEDRFFTLADVDGDGRADLALYTPADGHLQVALSNGDGTFRDIDRVYLASGDPAQMARRFFAMADVSGDGRADAIVYEFASGYVAVRLAEGDGRFGPSRSSYLGSGGSNEDRWVGVTDIDGDGRSDIAMFVPDSGVLTFLTATGDGRFVASRDTPPSFDAGGSLRNRAVLLADVNGDGNADLVIYDLPSGLLSVWRGRGTGTFEPPQRTYIGSGGTLDDRWFSMHDVNGDGRLDAIRYELATGALAIHFGIGDGTFESSGVPVFEFGSGGSTHSRWFFAADVTGDGKADMVRYEPQSGYLHVAPAYATWPELMTSVTSSLNVARTFRYRSLVDPAIYDRGSGAVHPQVDLQGPMLVLARSDVENGVGGHQSTTYRYGGLRAELGTGRGVLGFRWMEIQEAAPENALIKTRTTYRQGHPYTGTIERIEQWVEVGGTVRPLKRTESVHACIDPATGSQCGTEPERRFLVFEQQTVVSASDLGGTALPTLGTELSVDAWGNTRRIVVRASDGFCKITDNTYAEPDTANWILGRLVRTSVTSKSPPEGMACP